MASTTFTSGPGVCGSLDAAVQREWLVPDGRGGYAMGTVGGLRTRRYHGMLVVAGDLPARRMMAVASLDPVLTTPGGTRVRLGTHEWASGIVRPEGHRLLESFTLSDGLPTWRWRVGDVVLERTVAARAGGGVAVLHTLLSGHDVSLAVEPLCTWRDAHGERHIGHGLSVAKTADGVLVEDAYRVAGPGFEFDTEWYLGAYHREEAARGLNPQEDLLRVGRFTARLDAGDTMEITAWSGDTPLPPARQVIELARERAGRITAGAADATAGSLALAADAFIVETAAGIDVVAGYPWFGAWSRDTMTAYEGLFLATGRVEEGRRLLRTYAGTISEGMLANTADVGQTEYNTADATLWFLHAIDRHLHVTGDLDLAAELAGPLGEVITRHLAGCRYGIVVDPADGLLTQGAPGYALSWMDAVIGGVPVTPRIGKAVELNALWINGLGALAALRARLGQGHDDLDALRATAVASFNRRFVSPQGWLYDVVDGPAGDDDSLRPNQLLAFGLPYAPARDTGPGPVEAVGRELLTPLGLRTLAPEDPAYRGGHRGGPAERDLAYHQGTVWPWLIGPYADAAAAVGIDSSTVLDGLIAHLGEWGVGSISETADGDAPHLATGCPFQAWSVAETLRLYR